MKQKILIVLGAPNSDSGELSPMSKSRLNFCKTRYAPGNLVLCTGGWGEHFNTTLQSHASYAKDYLLKIGFSEDDFLPNALSQNTVDDAVKIKRILANLNNVKLTLITSDYHLERVTLIFKEILGEYPLEFVGVPSDLTSSMYNDLAQHETEAIISIKKNGLYY